VLKNLHTTRYVTPLREGGSLPAIVEANDDGLYVLKLRGAGQGVKALMAELIAGQLGRALGLRVPELALMDLDAAIGRAEPDDEIRDLLKASTGVNVAMDFLPGALMFDPATGPSPDPRIASSIVWFDAFITNVDRTAKNANLLVWHKELWLIDHGASLYFHHGWTDYLQRAKTPFPAIKDHVLLPWATKLPEVAETLRAQITPELIDSVLAAVPAAWFGVDVPFPTPADHRQAYRDYFQARVQAAPDFVAEAVRARSGLV
jgi:hypothetical protein